MGYLSDINALSFDDLGGYEPYSTGGYLVPENQYGEYLMPENTFGSSSQGNDYLSAWLKPITDLAGAWGEITLNKERLDLQKAMLEAQANQVRTLNTTPRENQTGAVPIDPRTIVVSQDGGDSDKLLLIAGVAVVALLVLS